MPKSTRIGAPVSSWYPEEGARLGLGAFGRTQSFWPRAGAAGVAVANERVAVRARMKADMLTEEGRRRQGREARWAAGRRRGESTKVAACRPNARASQPAPAPRRPAEAEQAATWPDGRPPPHTATTTTSMPSSSSLARIALRASSSRLAPPAATSLALAGRAYGSHSLLAAGASTSSSRRSAAQRSPFLPAPSCAYPLIRRGLPAPRCCSCDSCDNGVPASGDLGRADGTLPALSPPPAPPPPSSS
jgi:hypothetical protein